MTQQSPHPRPLVALPGERPFVAGIPHPIVVRVRAEETGGAFEVYEVSLSGEGTDLVAGPPPVTHREHEEVFYILDGEVEFSLGEDRAAAPTGTLIVIPRGGKSTGPSLDRITGGWYTTFHRRKAMTRDPSPGRRPQAAPSHWRTRSVRSEDASCGMDGSSSRRGWIPS